MKCVNFCAEAQVSGWSEALSRPEPRGRTAAIVLPSEVTVMAAAEQPTCANIPILLYVEKHKVFWVSDNYAGFPDTDGDNDAWTHPDLTWPATLHNKHF